MLFFIKEKGGYKIEAYISEVGLNLGAINMSIDQGKKVKIKGKNHILY
jgi:hypothetical protein